MNEKTEDLLQRLIDEVKKLNATAKVLNTTIEGWRTHTGSTGYFIQVATEDLTKSVTSLLGKLEAIKE